MLLASTEVASSPATSPYRDVLTCKEGRLRTRSDQTGLLMLFNTNIISEGLRFTSRWPSCHEIQPTISDCGLRSFPIYKHLLPAPLTDGLWEVVHRAQTGKRLLNVKCCSFVSYFLADFRLQAQRSEKELNLLICVFTLFSSVSSPVSICIIYLYLCLFL